MNFLAIEASELPTSIAIQKDDLILESLLSLELFRNSEEIIPTIKNILNESHLALSNLDCLIASNGPGSFTGLRVANAIIKGISLAFPTLPIVALSSLDMMLFAAASFEKNLKQMAAILCKDDIFFCAQKTNDSPTKKQMLSLSQIQCVQESGGFIIGINAYPNPDMKHSAKNLFKLGQHLFEKKLFANINDFSPIYSLTNEYKF